MESITDFEGIQKMLGCDKKTADYVATAVGSDYNIGGKSFYSTERIREYIENNAKAQEGAIGRVELINPAMAEKMLLNNNNNRRISRNVVGKYAQEMISGNWQLNYEPIVISKSGIIKNGQHRLNAIVKAGRPVQMYVVRNADDDISVYDRGYNRSEEQILYFMGVENASRESVAIAKLFYFMTPPGTSGVVSTAEIIAFLKHFDTQLKAFFRNTGGHAYKKLTAANVTVRSSVYGLACVLALDNGVPEEEIGSFLRSVKTGYVEAKEQSTAIVVRNMAISGAIDTAGSTHRSQYCRLIMTALNDYHNHTVRMRAYSVGKVKKTYIDSPKYAELVERWHDMTIDEAMK